VQQNCLASVQILVCNPLTSLLKSHISLNPQIKQNYDLSPRKTPKTDEH